MALASETLLIDGCSINGSVFGIGPARVGARRSRATAAPAWRENKKFEKLQTYYFSDCGCLLVTGCDELVYYQKSHLHFFKIEGGIEGVKCVMREYANA